MNSKAERTDLLYATPSFWSGAARVLDLFGVFDRYNQSQSPEEADAKAIASDWIMVGQDLKKVSERGVEG
ncbi:MAG: hypothetical protein ACRCYY_01660, partial [Trueperaceae bacterium]